MGIAPAPIIRRAGAGDQQSFAGGGVHTWKLLAEDTGGAFFVFEDVMTEGKLTPLHCHPEADETVYVLDGEILVQIDGVQTPVAAGGMTFTPRGTPHAFLVVSETARILTMQAPGIGQAFYRDASDPCRRRDGGRVRPRAAPGVRRGQSARHRDPRPTAVRRPDGPRGVATRVLPCRSWRGRLPA